MDFTSAAAAASPLPLPSSDSLFDKNPSSSKPLPANKSPEDGDTCRICRGEGSLDEPLFYPCKCSGSIKFVHQECLMEWLSHSQKKHCELCKTSFRFTKLYDSSMPSHLPTLVFLRKATLHVLQALLLWLRAFLVVAVWLVWLPWSMRFVWWGLFWIGDGGWTRDFDKLRIGLEADSALRPFTQPHHRNATDPVSTPGRSATALNRASSMLLSAASALLYSPIAVAKQIIGLFTSTKSPATTFTNATTPAVNGTGAHAASSTNESLLSYVSLLRNLTPNPAINKFIIDILEGLIITLAVVTAVILVFLIREWVVQQQPALNLAGLAEDEALQAEVPPAAAVPPQTTGDQPANGGSADYTALETQDVSLEHAEHLAQRLRDDGALMQAIVNGEAISIQGSLAGLKASRELILQTSAVVKGLEKTQKQAFDSGDSMKAQDTQAKLNLLNSALDHFPWTSELRSNEQAGDSEANPGEQGQQQQTEGPARPITSAIGESSTSVSAANDRHDTSVLSEHADSKEIETNESAARNPQGFSNAFLADRPSMPERVRSSLATNIQRDLQEATEPAGFSIAPSESVGSSASNESQAGWQHITSADAVSSDMESTPTIPGQRHPSKDSIPRLKRKQKTDRLSAGFQDQSDTMSKYSSPNDERERSEDAGDLPAPSTAPSATGFSSLSGNLVSTEENTAQGGVPFGETPIPVPQSSAQALSSDHPVPSQLSDPDQSLELNSDISLQDDIRILPDREGEPGTDAADSNLQAEILDIAPVDRTLRERMLDWLFDDPLLSGAAEGRDQDRDRNDEHVVEDLANEAPFVPFVEARPQNRARDHDAEPPNQNPEEAPEAVQAGANANDAEVVDDAEDLEGIFELIGMQGPLTGVFQNAVFCAVFIAATVTSAVWFPYLWGKLILLVLANPVQMVVALPLQTISGLTNFVIDLSLFGCGTALFWLDFVLRGVLRPVAWLIPAIKTVADSKRFASVIIRVVDSAVTRMSGMIFAIGRSSQVSHSHLSLSSLVALRVVQNQINLSLAKTAHILTATYNYTMTATSTSVSWADLSKLLHVSLTLATRTVNQLMSLLTRFLAALKSGDVSLTINHSTSSTFSEAKLLDWSPTDRLIAVSAGYMFFALAGALYIRRGSPFSTSQQGKKIERVITEMLQQSGGVLKVILIISIEMILFPLYCGLLLDVAMLPLFQSTFQSRIDFMISAPWTSAFIHWFLGTCYMFHFALFVSMCRKIFRSGVLYFIRDPDDPTFHPVRDVLDRSVSSQLRKIGFSAVVYGALVIICMGSVVWSVALLIRDMFPVRWASNSPFLGFPVDLLLYNLFAPLALQFFRPSKSLQRLYEKWFRFCANRLLLTEFLFADEKTEDKPTESRPKIEKNGDGRFVRVPASDQVRIPKGHRVFLDVDEENRRIDGLEDKEDGVHGKSNAHFTKVWIPPWYRLRIVLFAFCIWALTAVVGMSATILPLLIGRNALALLFPNAATINDIYAFSIGLFSVAAVSFTIFKIWRFWKDLERSSLLDGSKLASVSNSLRSISTRACRVLYTYSSLLILIPTLIALLIEFYFIMPLHTYTKLSQSSSSQETTTRTPTTHTVFFLQDCTLGLLYLRVFLRLLLWNPNSRPALALHAIVANGWLNPNVRIATRCFILPFTAITMLALCVPSGLAFSASQVLPLVLSGVNHSDPSQPRFSRLVHAVNTLEPEALRVYLIRFSYPFFLFLAAVAWTVLALGRAAGRWRARIKDEVYLIGERLHNFAERRPPPVPSRRVAGN